MTTTTFRPATQRQFDFLKTLVAERELDVTAQDWVRDARARAMRGGMSSSEASSLITHLLSLPKLATERELSAGVYESSNTLYRVYMGQQSGKLLVKRIEQHVHAESDPEQGHLVDILTASVEYRYLGAAASHLPRDARRLSLDEVGALGKAWDHCLACGRRLDDPESVDRGIGPVCAGKYDA